MKKQALCLIFGIALAGANSVASAEEPLTLTLDQMDQVTAGLFKFDFNRDQIGEATAEGGGFYELRRISALRRFAETTATIDIVIPTIAISFSNSSIFYIEIACGDH